MRGAGELCIVVCYAQTGGRKDWYLPHDGAELDAVLGRIPIEGAWGYSDRIEVYATGELPHRSSANHQLQQAALDVLRDTGEVLLACRLDGDPELQHRDSTTCSLATSVTHLTHGFKPFPHGHWSLNAPDPTLSLQIARS